MPLRCALRKAEVLGEGRGRADAPRIPSPVSQRRRLDGRLYLRWRVATGSKLKGGVGESIPYETRRPFRNTDRRLRDWTVHCRWTTCSDNKHLQTRLPGIAHVAVGAPRRSSLPETKPAWGFCVFADWIGHSVQTLVGSDTRLRLFFRVLSRRSCPRIPTSFSASDLSKATRQNEAARRAEPDSAPIG